MKLAVASLLAASAGASSSSHSVFVKETGATITIEVASASSFRLGVRFGWGPEALTSPSLDPARKPAPSQPVAWNGMSGLQKAFGALLADANGNWVFYDANNKTLVSSNGAPSLSPAAPGRDGGVVLPVQGTGSINGGGKPAWATVCLDLPTTTTATAGTCPLRFPALVTTP